MEFNTNDYQNLLAFLDRVPVKGIAEVEYMAVLVAKLRSKLVPPPVELEPKAAKGPKSKE